MVINFNEIIDAIVNHIPAFLIVVGVLFLFLVFFKLDLKERSINVIEKLPPVRLTIIGLSVLLCIAGLFLLFMPAIPKPIPPGVSTPTVIVHPTSTPVVQVTNTPAPSPVNDSASSLIPAGQVPVINDPLKDNSGGYQWDTGSFSGGNCNFVQGQYQVTAPAGASNGVGCSTESSNSNFSNFVYQIQMTILTGVDNDQSGAGVIFRVNTAGSGQQYQVLFDVAGDWSVATDSKDLSGGSCANPCPYFHAGANHPNVITVRAAGNSIQVQINEHMLGSYTDNTYTSGFIGVQMDPGTDNSSVAFSNVRVWQL